MISSEVANHVAGFLLAHFGRDEGKGLDQVGALRAGPMHEVTGR